MYEEYYGFVEKPFSLTPDPKYLYKSESHANAFELLQFAIRRREGFMVITGDIGTGKTTLCRALLDQLDRRTFSALVLNPFLSEEDLLRHILCDFGVLSREEARRGRLASVSKQELIDTLNDFLLSLLPLHASALLIIDEAQNLPVQVLEQIRILSNLETEKEKLLQIVLVGQLNLQRVLRSPEMRQLDQRVSIRYELKPLTRDETSVYISHRLTIAGGGVVSFTSRALEAVHRHSGGIPRLINLICDRALLGSYSARTNRVQHDVVLKAAEGLDLTPSGRGVLSWVDWRRAAMFAGLIALGGLAGAGAVANSRGWLAATGRPVRAAESRTAPAPAGAHPATMPQGSPAAPQEAGRIATSGSVTPPATADMPSANAASGSGQYTILVASFKLASEADQLVATLQDLGYRAFQEEVRLGDRGVWRQVRVGRYDDLTAAQQAALRIRRLPGYSDAHLSRN